MHPVCVALVMPTKRDKLQRLMASVQRTLSAGVKKDTPQPKRHEYENHMHSLLHGGSNGFRP